jgi:hypothetical protein
VTGLPEAAGEGSGGRENVGRAPTTQRWQRPLDRIGDGLYGRITGAFELDDLFGLHVVLEVGREARQQVAEQRVGDEPVDQRLGDPGRRHRAGCIQFRADHARPAASEVGAG